MFSHISNNKFRLAGWIACGCAFFFQAQALNGIAVVDHNLSDMCRPSADIYRLDMTDDHFSTATPLYLRADHPYNDGGKDLGYGGWSPAIDFSGTYVAFGKETASGWKLSVMSIDSGESELYDIASLSGMPSDIQWLADGFIYYVIDGGPSINKIFPQPGAVSEVAHTAQGNLNLFNSDAFFTRLAVLENPGDNETNIKYDFRGSSTVRAGFGGCSGAISPSGNWLVGYLDPGHFFENISKFDNNSPATPVSVTHDTANLRWAVVEPDSQFPYCPGYWMQYMPLGRSGDTQGHDWAVNSDDIVIAQLDFMDRTDNDCGQNMVLFDMAEKKAWNVTKNAITGGAPDWNWVNDQCYIYKSDIDIPGDPPGGLEIAQNRYPAFDAARVADGSCKISSSTGARSDFWVSSLEKVNDTLRCYVADRDAWRDYWHATLNNESATAPAWRKIDDVAQAPTSVFQTPAAPPMRVFKNPDGSLTLVPGAQPLSSIRIMDSQGRLVQRIDGILNSPERIPVRAQTGVYILSAKSHGTAQYFRFAVK